MDKNRTTLIKLLFFALLVAAVAAAAWYHAHAGHFSEGEFKKWAAGYGRGAPLMFAAVYALAVSLGFPPTPLTIAGGLVFGRGLGTALNAVGLTLGAAGAFWVSRLLLHGFVAPRLEKRKWFGDFNEGVEKNGFYYVLFIRLLPIFPYGAVNFAAGITRVRFVSFLLGTALGVVPHVFIFTNAVVEAGESAAHGLRVTTGLVFSLALAALAVAAPLLVSLYLKRRAR
ncbi:MAG: TVP38/TMEM64 family protein [Nitrospinae bacterium]|nr:TVP38/TMEM64 family protein [Nitrospinota bacterium]